MRKYFPYLKLEVEISTNCYQKISIPEDLEFYAGTLSNQQVKKLLNSIVPRAKSTPFQGLQLNLTRLKKLQETLYPVKLSSV